MQELQQKAFRFDLKAIMKKINKYNRVIEAKHRVILDSTNLNDQKYLIGQVGGKVVDKRLSKIRPWLDKPLSGEVTTDERLLRQLKRVEILECSESVSTLVKEDLKS